jgi:hypothetical protein
MLPFTCMSAHQGFHLLLLRLLLLLLCTRLLPGWLCRFWVPCGEA